MQNMYKYSTYLRTDVTAVAIHHSGSILAGVGSNLYIYSKQNELLIQQHCLNGQKIYGLIPNSSGDRYIVFGGKQFTIVASEDIAGSPQLVIMFKATVCEDWLHSALWALEADKILLLTAHNVVLSYNINTLTCSRFANVDNSILYSGLLVPIKDDILVMAGTVYSEVILQLWREEKPLHRLQGHKGVIFSISCHPQKSIIVTTSDDRSVRIWGPKTPHLDWENVEHWRNEILCKHELYGHHARVMRSIINDAQIISVGEDSRICFWSFDGVLIKRIKRHQNAGIWSIAANNHVLVTGGGDGAVISQDISIADEAGQVSSMLHLWGTAKQIAYTAKENFFILMENNIFVYYDNEKDAATWTQSILNQYVTAYHSLSVSPCRKMCALAGRKTSLMLATEDEHSHVTFETVTLEKDSVLSVHWATEDTLVACLDNGLISIVTITNTVPKACTMFELPLCKERWLTCAAANHTKDIFVLGDRCGSLHMFRSKTKIPCKTICKLHGRYGPTSISMLNDELITTGRDRTIKYFKISDNDLINTGSCELDFHWVERFLDVTEMLVCGFKEKMFVVHNVRQNEGLLEIECGGGHRSYDVLYTKKGTSTLKLAYLKSSTLHTETIQLNKHTANTVVAGSHSKEINCLKTIKVGGKTLFLSGGEDTTIRVSVLEGSAFHDILFYKQLSSIKTLKICKNNDDILMIAAGGRAQICVKSIKLRIVKYGHYSVEIDTRNLVDYMLKGTDKQRKGERNWKNVTLDSDPETRIMDVDYVKYNDGYKIFAGCSDACVRVFDLNSELATFEMVKESWYPHCILKTVCVNYLNQDWLVTGSTRGEVAFWKAHFKDFEPFFVTQTNKSGINAIAIRSIPDDKILIATGGDDNALHFKVIYADRDNLNSFEVLHTLVLDKHHSSAITGLCFVGDHILSTSIDQRITLYRLKVADTIECSFVYQTFSDVADIKGMDVITCDSSSISVCVFGKGLEVFKIPIPLT